MKPVFVKDAAQILKCHRREVSQMIYHLPESERELLMPLVGNRRVITEPGLEKLRQQVEQRKAMIAARMEPPIQVTDSAITSDAPPIQTTLEVSQ